ncbi:MAG TPA: ABC transporter permease [Candidatus Limnocylindria bacterium]|nr:ABC transporter permease [Candidatus Limnocylindria bacterium]
MKQRTPSIINQEMPFFMSVPALVWQVLLFYVPMALMVVLSFTSSSEQGNFFTLDQYATFADPAYGAIILRSFFLACMSAFVCVLCAYPIAHYLTFTLTRWKTQMLFFLVLPFWISALVQVYAWFFVLEKHGLLNSLLLKLGVIREPLLILNTPWAVFFVMVYCYLPFAIMPIYSTLEKFDKRLLEASADLGATPWQTFFRVTLPLSTPGIRTGFFLVFVPSFGEFVIPTLLGGSKQMYVGSLISHYYLTVRNFHLGSAFTCVSGVVLVVVSLLVYLIFKRLGGATRSQ